MATLSMAARLELIGRLRDSKREDANKKPYVERDLLLFSPRQQYLILAGKRGKDSAARREGMCGTQPELPRGMSSQVTVFL